MKVTWDQPKQLSLRSSPSSSSCEREGDSGCTLLAIDIGERLAVLIMEVIVGWFKDSRSIDFRDNGETW